jgi:hypothetical protein
MSQKWKYSIIAPVYMVGNKTDCNNCESMSLLSISYKILFNILLSRLSPYVDEMTGGHHVTNQPLTKYLALVRYRIKK